MGIDEKQTYSIEFVYDELQGNIDNFKILSLLINESDEVENTESTPLRRALEIDLSTSTNNIENTEWILKTHNNDLIEISEGYQNILSIRLLNIQGEIVKTINQINTPAVQIDISNIPSGSYIILVEGEKNTDKIKYVKPF